MLRKILFRGIISLVLILALGLVALALMKPSAERPWKPEHAVMPKAEFSGDQVTIQNIRNFRTHAGGAIDQAYDNRTYDLTRLESLWYALAVFHKDDWRGPAHSMFSFGFADGSFVVISVEARKEVGEEYSTWKGLLNQYEIIYVIGDERDLILTRAVHKPDDVYLYPVDVSPRRSASCLSACCKRPTS